VNKHILGIVCGALLSLNLFAASEIADAVMNKDKAALAASLNKKADVNAAQADGTTALHWAVRWDDREAADVLIAAGADVKTANREGATPLFVACESGNTAMIEKLLKAGEDANAVVLMHGETALMMAARSGNTDAVRVLLDHGANPNTKETLGGTTALMWAAEENHAEVIRLLASRGAEVNAQALITTPGGARRGGNGIPSATEAALAAAAAAAEDYVPPPKVKGGMTALVIAARSDNLESVKALLSAGAKVNQTSADGTSPLLAATQNGFYGVGRYLLDNGADANVANSKGWTPLYIAVKNRNLETGTIPLPSNVAPLDFIQLLVAKGADPNKRISADTEVHSGFKAQWLKEAGATPFFRAAVSGDLTVMKLLMEHGADPLLPTGDHTTPLMGAAGIGWSDGFSHEYSENETLEAMQLLLDKGADVNAINDQGMTALHGAAHKAANNAILLLVARGAKLDIRDKGKVGSFGNSNGGLIPLEWAQGVPIGASSGIYKADTVELLTRLMQEHGVPLPAASNRTMGGNVAAGNAAGKK
jgi:ankyrin repeat protein